MATVTRQPFAPLDGTRLQNLTSLKNRQNALPPTSGKRKAELIDTDDFENVDPSAFAKRSKSSTSTPLSKDILKPSAFLLKATPTPASAPASTTSSILSDLRSTKSPTKSIRRTLHPKSPIARLNTGITKSSPINAPAGRSPTRSKRSGISSTRRRTGPYTRVDPPSFGLGSAAPFSLDAALKGTIPGYASKPAPKESFSALNEPDAKDSWCFEIHEDTPEQEMTNLLQHSTCTLDISSDEESQRKISRDLAEGLDKENIPPADDISQTSRRPERSSSEDMLVEKERVALGEMNATDFYAAGFDETSIIIIPGDDEEQTENRLPPPPPPTKDFAFAPELKAIDAIDTIDTIDTVDTIPTDIDTLMSKPTQGSTKAAVLEPIEGTGETFELWESSSAKDDAEPVTTSN